MDWTARHSLAATATHAVELARNLRTCTFNHTLFDSGAGRHQAWFNVTFVFADAHAYPVSAHGSSIEFLADSRRQADVEWGLLSETRGQGPFWGPASLTSPRPAEATEWTGAPIEGESPFPYAMAAALGRIALDRGYQEYQQDHPAAFLASAAFATLVDQTEGQVEHLWTFVWMDGTAALFARCHRLISPLPVDLPGIAYEEEMCFDLRPFETPLSLARTSFSAATISWEEAAHQWRLHAGTDLFLGAALWSTIGAAPVMGPAVGDRFSVITPRYAFSFYPGTLDSAPYSPSWLVERPASESRALSMAWSVFDADTGYPGTITVPTVPSWLAQLV